MAKTVYSLVLDDEVMKLVDKAARRGGLSRSAYINQALAENVGYETALKKNADLFRCVEDLLRAARQSALLYGFFECGDSYGEHFLQI